MIAYQDFATKNSQHLFRRHFHRIPNVLNFLPQLCHFIVSNCRQVHLFPDQGWRRQESKEVQWQPQSSSFLEFQDSRAISSLFIILLFFLSICHTSCFRSCVQFLLQGLVIQAHLWLSPMVPICGTLWHCRQPLIRICRDRQYLHDMFQHFPRKRNSRTVKFLTLVTNTLAFFVAGPWFLAYALNWKRESKYMFNQISASLTIWSVLTTNTKSQSVQRGLSCLSRQMSATEPLWRLVVGRTVDGACALERESITLWKVQK